MSAKDVATLPDGAVYGELLSSYRHAEQRCRDLLGDLDLAIQDHDRLYQQLASLIKEQVGEKASFSPGHING